MWVGTAMKWGARANLEESSPETGKGFLQSCTPSSPGDPSSKALSPAACYTPPPAPSIFLPIRSVHPAEGDRNQNTEQRAQTIGLQSHRFPSGLYQADSRAKAWLSGSTLTMLHMSTYILIHMYIHTCACSAQTQACLHTHT